MFQAIEVVADREALDRQNAQQEVADLLRLIDEGAIVGDDEWTTWESGDGQS